MPPRPGPGRDERFIRVLSPPTNASRIEQQGSKEMLQGLRKGSFQRLQKGPRNEHLIDGESEHFHSRTLHSVYEIFIFRSRQATFNRLLSRILFCTIL